MSSGSPKRRRVVRRGSRAIGEAASSSSSSARRHTARPSRSTKKRGGSQQSTNTHGRNRQEKSERGHSRQGTAQRHRSSQEKAHSASQRRRSQAPQRPQAAERSQAAQQPAVSALADTSTTFADLGLPLSLVQALKSEGIVHPFPIQARAIPQALEGRDVLGRGPTGSGKTFTFGLPIISKLTRGASPPQSPRAVILVPTRELATQVRSRLEPLANAAGQRVLEVVGGVKIIHNIRALARPVDILVATPGRAQDLLEQRHLTFDDVQIVALDEADQMADMGFLPQVTKLLNRIPKQAQHLLFSATLDGDVQILVDKFMKDPVEHSTGEAKVRVDSMTHYLGVVPDGPARNQMVVELGKLSTRTIMFVRTKYAVDRMAKKLLKAGVAAVALHGNKGQNTRTAAIEDFTSGAAQVLVATDIAARGIDITGVDLVVHADVPAEHKAYVHRAGRTARAGTSGTVVTLTFPDAVDDALKLLKKAGVEPEQLSAEELLQKISTLKGRQ